MPGSSRVGPVVYVDAVLAGMPPPVREDALAAIDALAPAAAAGRRRARRARAHARVRLRPGARDRGVLQRLRRAGRDGPGRVGRDRLQLAARDPPRQGLVVPGDRHEGALRRRRRRVGRRRRRRRGRAGAARPRRAAARDRAAPARPPTSRAGRRRRRTTSSGRSASRRSPSGELVAFLAGRCVGGTTTINTKVALRAHERDVAKWHPATGLTNERGEPFAAADLAPYYDRVEQVLGVRERSDWPKSVHTVEPGFRALGAELEPVQSYTDANCMQCGSCLQGCPTNAGKSTMNTYIARRAARAASLDLRPDCHGRAGR